MKLLEAKPSVPPYLHLGSIRLVPPATSALAGTGTWQLEIAWRKILSRIADDPRMLHAICKRSDERESDPNYTEQLGEVFATITDDGLGPAIVDFYF